MSARPPHVTVRASGDTVGNNALITVGHPSDGSTSIVIENHRTTQTAWLLPRQAVELAAALLRPVASNLPPKPITGGSTPNPPTAEATNAPSSPRSNTEE